MSVHVIRLILDFGLLVLIWIVQLIIYPSFMYYNTNNLIKWHKVYVSKFALIVIPIMLAQLGLAIYQVVMSQNVYTLSGLIIIISVWAFTFFKFVPIHDGILKGIVNDTILKTLVYKNWIRTILWTLVFIISCIYSVFIRLK